MELAASNIVLAFQFRLAFGPACRLKGRSAQIFHYWPFRFDAKAHFEKPQGHVIRAVVSGTAIYRA